MVQVRYIQVLLSRNLTSEIPDAVPERVPQPLEGAAAPAVPGERSVVRARPQVHQLRQRRLSANALTDYIVNVGGPKNV